MIHLVLGGARSGKSSFAEQQASGLNLPVTYIATAQAWDDEMQTRITHHQQQRPQHWYVLEEPFHLAQKLVEIDQPNHVILVDCLTLWLSNLLMKNDNLWQSEMQKLYDVLPTLQAHVFMVSNETGLGVVPMGQLTRQFVDESGRMHQKLGQISDQVTFCVAGFPMVLKGAK